jgi:hypothetical protein
MCVESFAEVGLFFVSSSSSPDPDNLFFPVPSPRTIRRTRHETNRRCWCHQVCREVRRIQGQGHQGRREGVRLLLLPPPEQLTDESSLPQPKEEVIGLATTASPKESLPPSPPSLIQLALLLTMNARCF